MEIGFALASGAQVFGICTDFIRYQSPNLLVNSSWGWRFPDVWLDETVHEVPLVLSEDTVLPGRYEEYRDGLQRAINAACESTAQTVQDRWTERSPQPLTPAEPKFDVFIDATSGHEPSYWRQVEQLLAKDVSVAVRFDPFSTSGTSFSEACSSRYAIVDGRGPVVSAGSAMLLGARAAARKDCLLYAPDTALTLAPGREPNSRNLMLLYGASTVVSDYLSPPELVEYIQDCR